MVWNTGLAQVAEFHVHDLGSEGKTGSKSSDGTSMADRANKFGSNYTTYSENSTYNKRSALEVIISMVVNDGVKSRAHRTNIFDAEFHVMGCFSGKHIIHNTMTTLCMADSFNY